MSFGGKRGATLVPSTPSRALDAVSVDTPGDASLNDIRNLPSPIGDEDHGPSSKVVSFLQKAAHRWPSRSGGCRLQSASGTMNYDFYLASDISSEDEEQLRLDVERSVVDGLEDLYVAPLVDDAAMQAALYRLLRAWCSRHPSGYCQGMNFVGAVLLVVMHHGRWGGEPAAADEEEPPTRNARAEEDAFWTFCALMEVMLPPDFYAAPHMPGLQLDARVLVQLFLLARRPGGALAALGPTSVADSSVADSSAAGEAAGEGDGHEGGGEAEVGPSDDEWRDILRLSAYKWFVPCFVNCLPLPTLLLYWDRLLLRAPADGTPNGTSSAHLMLALALLKLSADGASEAMAGSRREGRAEEGMGLVRLHAIIKLATRGTVATPPIVWFWVVLLLLSGLRYFDLSLVLRGSIMSWRAHSATPTAHSWSAARATTLRCPRVSSTFCARASPPIRAERAAEGAVGAASGARGVLSAPSMSRLSTASKRLSCG